MFKKPVQIGNKKDLGRKGSMRVLDVLVRYTSPPVSAVDSLLQVTPQNLADTLIYLSKSEHEPIAFVKEGDSIVYPSLYFLWHGSCVLPVVFVGSFVSGYILSGADLMLPGVIRQVVKPFNTGDLVQLMVPGTAHAFAIGVAEISSADFDTLSDDQKGRAVRLVHYFGDGLWRMGSKSIPPGFDFDRISRPDPSPAPVVSVNPDSPPQSDCTLSPEQMDQVAYVSFLDVVKSVSESDLPMNASSMYSRMQYSVKNFVSSSTAFHKKHDIPLGDVKLDLKKSSHKSLKEFVEFLMNKKSIMSAKTMRNELVVISFNMSHPDVVGYTKPAEKDITSESTETMIQVTRYYSVDESWSKLLAISSKNELYSDMKPLMDLCSTYLRTNAPSSVEILLKSKIFSNKTSVSKQEFSLKFKQDLIRHYSVSTELPPRVHRGDPPKVGVSVKKVKGGGGRKMATVVSGLDKYFLEEHELAKIMANKFSVSTSVNEKDGILIQGDLKGKVFEFLVTVVGIPKEFIS